MGPSASGSNRTLEDAGDQAGSRSPPTPLGVWGRAMLAALVRGERDRKVLAALAKGRLRNKLPQLRQALRGRFRSIMGCWSGWPLTTRGHLEAAIARLDARVDGVIAPFALARDRLGDHHRGRQTRRRGHHRRHAASTCRPLRPPATWPPGRAAARATTSPGQAPPLAGPPRASTGWPTS